MAGRVNINSDDDANITIRINGNTANIVAGGNGETGDLKLKDDKGADRIIFSAGVNESAGGGLGEQNEPIDGNLLVRLRLLNADERERVSLDATGHAVLGGHGIRGQLSLKDDSGMVKLLLSGTQGQARLGGDKERPEIFLDGANGNVFAHQAWLGGRGREGLLVIFPKEVNAPSATTEATIYLDGVNGDVVSHSVLVGGRGRGGQLIVYPPTVDNFGRPDESTIWLDGDNGNVSAHRAWLGGRGQAGLLTIFPDKVTNPGHTNEASIYMDGKNGVAVYRAKDASGNLRDRIQMSASSGSILVGGGGSNGRLTISGQNGRHGVIEEAAIDLDGASGDIVLRNADCAEDFDVAESEKIEPGTVMVLNQEGNLRESTDAYDKKVAGVISGAGDFKPGIVLDKRRSQKNRLPVALMGKAYCKVDAEYSSIEVGDLLTTSPTRGHAMKASDPLKAFGAVIGKALRPLPTGRGLIPVLIALQ